MNEDQYTEPDREEVTRAVLQNFQVLIINFYHLILCHLCHSKDCNHFSVQVLIDTDVRATARLVLMDFPLDLAEVTYKLQANPAEQFNFLQGIFDPK